MGEELDARRRQWRLLADRLAASNPPVPPETLRALRAQIEQMPQLSPETVRALDALRGQTPPEALVSAQTALSAMFEPSREKLEPSRETRPAGPVERRRRGGRYRKEHPGIAVHEAAHLILQHSDTSDVEIAAAATAKARAHPEITDRVIAKRRWENGMHRKQVPRLRDAIDAKLVRVKGKDISVRSALNEAWRPVRYVDWVEIPRVEQRPLA